MPRERAEGVIPRRGRMRRRVDPVAGHTAIETLEQSLCSAGELDQQWGYDDQTQAGLQAGRHRHPVQGSHEAGASAFFGHLLSGWI